MKATAIVVFLLINRIRLGLIMSKVQSTTTKEPEPKVPVALKVLGGDGELVMKGWRESENDDFLVTQYPPQPISVSLV